MIIQNVGEVLDPSIAPILDKAFVKIGSSVVIKFNEKMVSYKDSFRMYLTTKLGNNLFVIRIWIPRMLKSILCLSSS